MSVSYWHNALAANESWAFTSGVNATGGNRECMAYTAVVPLDGGPVHGQTSRRLAVTYNR